MARRPRGSANGRRRKGKVLARLEPKEGAGVLRTILERHPELAIEAEEIAKATMTDVDAEAVAEDVEQAVLDLTSASSTRARVDRSGATSSPPKPPGRSSPKRSIRFSMT